MPGPDDLGKHYQAAATHIDTAPNLYAKVIRPGLHELASNADLAISEALTSAQNGNAPALAAASAAAWVRFVVG